MARGLLVKNLLLWVCLLLVAYGAKADEETLLDCTRYDGTQKFQIYINISKGYVLYNADTKDSFDRIQKFEVKNHPDGNVAHLDLGLEILTNDDWVLEAAGPRVTFLYVKETASFAYAWTTAVQAKNGTLAAFGNHHTGTCTQRPEF